jgi:plastocyanin
MFKLLFFTLLIFFSSFVIFEQITILGQEVKQSAPTVIIIPGASEPITKSPFFPSSLNLPIGSTVNWINKDQVTHTVTSFTLTFDSGLLSPNQSFVHTFFNPGYYNYYCTLHPYMSGAITIS